jgi:DNA-binding NarL/FixJ family response regulator
MTIKLLFVEGRDDVREGIKVLFDKQGGFSTLQTNDLLSIPAIIKEQQTNCLLLDIDFIGLNYSEKSKKIIADFPEIKILLVTSHTKLTLADLLNSSANGYILKNSSFTEYQSALKKIIEDGLYLNGELTMNLLRKYLKTIEKPATALTNPPITPRERDVLNLMAEGFTNSEMAKKLFTSVRTIETRRKNLLIKTGTTNTATLIRYAVLNGLIS